jgi:hypothetical protein
MKTNSKLKDGLIRWLALGSLCILVLSSLSIGVCRSPYQENVTDTKNPGTVKLVYLKAFPFLVENIALSRIGPLWLPLPWSQLQFDIPFSLHLKINGKTQNVDLPVRILLRYILGFYPMTYELKHYLNATVFAVCGDLTVIPYSYLENYIYDQPLFNVSDTATFGQATWGLTSADFNNDGYTDFAVAWADCPFTHSGISIFYNDENGGFTRNDVYTFNYNYITDLNAGDYNNDGHIDLLFTYSEYTVYQGLPVNINGVGTLLLNDATNHFHNATTVFWHGPGEPYNLEDRINPKIITADFDMDGNPDFLVGDGSGKVELYDNDGAGNFTSEGIINDWGMISRVTPGDFDGDGDNDFCVAANSDDSNGRIYFIQNQMKESNGTTVFATGYGKAILGFSSSIPGACLQNLDYNNDGKLDLLIGLDDTLTLCLTNQSTFDIFSLGQLPRRRGYNDVLDMGALTSADYNNDGKADFVIGGVQGVVRLGLNNYSPWFTPFKPEVWPARVVVNKISYFGIKATDFYGGNVSYYIDWGDGTNSGWVGPYPSGVNAELNHTWTRALTFLVHAKAKNNYGESKWATTYRIVEKHYGSQIMESLLPFPADIRGSLDASPTKDNRMVFDPNFTDRFFAFEPVELRTL